MFSMFFLPSSCATKINKVWSNVIPLLQSSCLCYPFVALKMNEAWDTWRPHIKARCITWCFWSDSDSDNVISSKRPVLASFCLEDAEKSKQNHGAGGIGVSRIHKLCELSEWKAIHIQLSYDCPGFKLINSPMTGTMRSSEKIWQDIP